VTVDDVVASIAAVAAGYVFNHTTEDDLQAALAEQLTLAGLPAVREVRLADAERIDLMVGTVGVEVKVGGTPAAVLRQLARYAATGKVTALVLVSTRHLHRTLDGKTLHDVPVKVVRPAWM
jgi:hypothetical protein